MESQSIAQKQQYLRENIIDAGYDAEDFVQYCTKEHNLADLADWPMQKLMQVVQLYISIKRTQNSRPYNPNNDDDDWTNFEEAPAPLNDNQKIQLKNQAESHHNSTKTGQLVFSEADWGIFLGQNTSGSHSSTAKHAFEPEKKSETKGSNNKNKQSLNTIGLSEKQAQKLKQTSKKVQITGQGAFENIGKQNPLSPPSQNIKKQLSNISGLIEQGSLKRQNRGPINFTNVKLTTSKTKAMPKLPQINDITITKTQQVSRNFLQSDYTLYHIHFAPGNHTIQRKFTDFRKLRGILQNMYPHVRLPYLEPEGWLTSSQGKDTQTLAKYKWMILDFLKYIVMRNNQLKNCPLVRKFCGYSTSAKSQKQYQDVSKQDLKKVFQFYQNLPRAKTIGQICLSNNFVILPPSSDGQKLISSTVNLMQQIDHEYEKLKKKFDVLFYNYDLLAKSLSDVSSSFQTLQNLIKKYNGENDQPKEFRIYEGLKEICIKMHNSMNQQFVVFKVRMKNILRYQKDNMMTLKQLFDCKNKIHYEYAKQGYPSLSKGSQSGCGEIQIESNISLQEPCKSNKNTLCVQQIFWSHFTKQEIKCYWQQLRKKINEQLTMISYEQLDNENENLNFWNSMIKKCVV